MIYWRLTKTGYRNTNNKILVLKKKCHVFINRKGCVFLNYQNNRAENVKIAYIGGGSRGWAWGLMSDLAKWTYQCYPTLEETLKDVDFVVISILPGTFDEMESDVHEPEKYGIYQSVGDSTGPGGIIRALRTIPMFEVIGNAICENCPNAWVINYTNPMSVCVAALYKVFPQIKAFGRILSGAMVFKRSRNCKILGVWPYYSGLAQDGFGRPLKTQ